MFLVLTHFSLSLPHSSSIGDFLHLPDSAALRKPHLHCSFTSVVPCNVLSSVVLISLKRGVLQEGLDRIWAASLHSQLQQNTEVQIIAETITLLIINRLVIDWLLHQNLWCFLKVINCLSHFWNKNAIHDLFQLLKCEGLLFLSRFMRKLNIFGLLGC